jgi:predicted Zn-dependent protease
MDKMLNCYYSRFGEIIALFAVFLLIQPTIVLSMTIGDEREIGEKLLYSVRKEFHLLDDPDIAQYMQKLGGELVNVAGPQYFDYRFFVVQNKEFNAFAAPSGLIFFFTGLIEKMDSEDELVSVLAHEIGHVVSRHIAGRLEKDKTIGVVTTALAMASLALGNPALAQGLFTGSLAAGQALSLNYSRHDEEEADRLAFEWMKTQNRNPGSMLGMLQAMRRITRYRTDQVPAYLLTHPNPEMRLDYIASLLDVEQADTHSDRYEKTDNFAFIRMKYRLMAQVHEGDELRIFFEGMKQKKKDPWDAAMADYGLALLSAKEFDYKNALKKIQAVRKQFPDKHILKVDEGIIYLESGRNDSAYEILEKAVQEDPGDMYAVFHLARVLEKKGQGKQARNLYLKVEKRMPEYSHLYYALGRLESEQGRPVFSNYYLGKHYLYEGKLQLARQNFQIIKDDSTAPESLRGDVINLLRQIEKIDK